MSACVSPVAPISPNDPRLNTPDGERTIHDYDPQARALADRGYFNRAERLDNCRRLHRTWEDKQGHRWRTSRHCEMRTCIVCEPELLREIFDAYHDKFALVEHSEGRSDRLSSYTVDISVEESNAAMREWSSTVRSKLLKVARHDHGGDHYAPIFVRPIGFRDGKLRFRLLPVCACLTPERIRDIWPDAFIHTTFVPAYRLRTHMRDVFLALDLPEDPIARADQELLFEGVDQFHAISACKCCMPDEKALGLSVKGLGEEDLTDNPSDSKVKRGIPRCPQCGDHPVRVTGWHRLSAAPLDRDDVQWFPVTG